MDKQRLLFASVLMAMMSSAALAQTNVTGWLYLAHGSLLASCAC